MSNYNQTWFIQNENYPSLESLKFSNQIRVESFCNNSLKNVSVFALEGDQPQMLNFSYNHLDSLGSFTFPPSTMIKYLSGNNLSSLKVLNLTNASLLTMKDNVFTGL